MKTNQTKRKPIFRDFNKKLLIVVILLLVGFFGTQFYIKAFTGISNAEIEQVRSEKDRLRLENEILTSQIAEKKSLANVKQVADELGLVETNIQEIKDPALSDNLASSFQ